MSAPGQARFDAAFFARYYEDPRTRVADAADGERLAGLIGGVLDYLELPVRSILDVGCGVGRLREPLARAFPRARYTGLEVSAYLCRRYGWVQGSLASHRSRAPYDLVVCHDVAQYLADREAVLGLANLARLSRAALYFSAPTRRDWARAADHALSDPGVRRRGADWYRARLRRHFRHVAAGVHVRRGLTPILWQLEEPWR